MALVPSSQHRLTPRLPSSLTIDLPNGYSLQDWPAAWKTGDQDRFIAFANDHDVWKNLADHFPHPYTKTDAEAWVALQSGVNPPQHFAICDTQGPIGSIGLTPFKATRVTPQKSVTGSESPSGAAGA